MAAVTERAVQAVVNGVVQGVGFRWFVQKEAQRLGLPGWVRNLPSGDVEFAVRGPASGVASLIEVVRRGPPHAVVRDVRVSDAPSGTEYPNPFNIRH